MTVISDKGGHREGEFTEVLGQDRKWAISAGVAQNELAVRLNSRRLFIAAGFILIGFIDNLSLS